MAHSKGKTAKQQKALGLEPQATHIWEVKTASGQQVTARLLRAAERRGQWWALNLATNRDVRVNARGFIRRIDPPAPAPERKPSAKPSATQNVLVPAAQDCPDCTPEVPCLRHVVACSDALLATPEAQAAIVRAELAALPGEIDMAGPARTA